jgi:hypothetical protein
VKARCRRPAHSIGVPHPETAFTACNRQIADFWRETMKPPSTRSACARLIALVLGFTLCAPAPALIYRVGAGAVPSVCDYNDLQQAISAAANSPGEDFIRVANNQGYTAQALSIGQQDLTITGGYPDCAAATPPEALPTSSTTLNGAGGAAAPVISITGSGVRVLTHLQIRNGDNVQGNGSGCGGGVRFVGRGELRIQNTGIALNTANTGGGICFSGTAAPAALTIDSDVSINNNEASTGNGGGIAIGGHARLFVLRERTLIAFNRALEGDGGGIYMSTPARADIGSPGFNGLAVLYANEARRGGGVAGYAPDDGDGDTCFRFFSTDATTPVRLQDNRASGVGGAIYLRSNAEFDPLDNASMIGSMFDFRIDGNTAPNGPAIFLDGSSAAGVVAGSSMYFNTNTGNAACNDSMFDLGRQVCSNAADCNRIENNIAADFNGQLTNGNVIELQDESLLIGATLTMIGNAGTRLISTSSESGTVGLSRCALVGNSLTQELFRAFVFTPFELKDCTIAGNTIGASHVLRFDTSAASMSGSLKRVLLDQPGKLTLSHPDSALFQNASVLATDISTLPGVASVREGHGRYIDPERGDYRQRIGSQGVDYAPIPSPAEPGDTLDLDRRPRNVDLGSVTTSASGRDLGPYERQKPDPWMLNGDFVGDLRLWSNPDTAYSAWDGTFNAPGSSGGSLVFSVPSDQITPTERRSALIQCFNVPSAGAYQITGLALVAPSINNRDYPLLNWRLRYQSEDCSGPESASGESFFGRSPTTWQPLGVPVVITVDPLQWTWNTTIEVRLEAAQNVTSPTATSLFARYDDIEIGKFTNELFDNGFETP